MFHSSDGRLWVQRDRPAPLMEHDVMLGVAGARYDVFDAEGRYLGEVQAPERLRALGATREEVYGFEIDDQGAIWVVAYRMELVRRVTSS
jgi:hypothetical protein